MTQEIIDSLLDPIQTRVFTTDPPVALISGAIQDPQNDLEKHSIFKLVSKAEKSAKPSPGHPQNTQNRPSNYQQTIFVKTWFLQYLPPEMLDSGAPDVHIRTTKSLKNVTCKHACQKRQLLCQSWPTTFKWRPRNPSKIDRNPSLDPQGLLPCAPKSPCIARWSPRCQIGRSKHAK